ncbi:Inner tegument protein [Trichinella pseudospiralis]
MHHQQQPSKQTKTFCYLYAADQERVCSLKYNVESSHLSRSSVIIFFSLSSNFLFISYRQVSVRNYHFRLVKFHPYLLFQSLSICVPRDERDTSICTSRNDFPLVE